MIKMVHLSIWVTLVAMRTSTIFFSEVSIMSKNEGIISKKTFIDFFSSYSSA